MVEPVDDAELTGQDLVPVLHEIVGDELLLFRKGRDRLRPFESLVHQSGRRAMTVDPPET